MSEDKPRDYRCSRCGTLIYKREVCPTCNPDWKPDHASFVAGCEWERTTGDNLQSQLATRLKIPQENVTVDNVVALVEAANCIQHWHDAHDGGMVVSGNHVRELWAALAPFAKEGK